MAMDEALARTLHPEEGVLRIYRWSRPTLSLGRNQSARSRYDPEAFGPLGAEVVRRPTGGREVLHDRELTYALVVPLNGPGDLRAVYRLVNDALVAAVGSLGVRARTAPRTGRTPRPEAGACFRRAAEGEVEVEGRKLVGSAQVRLGSCILQHGSLLMGPASVSLSAFLQPVGEEAMLGGDAMVGNGHEEGDRGGVLSHGPGPSPTFDASAGAGGGALEQRGATLAEVLGRPVAFGEVARAVEAALAGTLGGTWRRGDATPETRQVAMHLRDRYESWEWTWRR
jgi:lipoate-protein ligase A